MPALMRRSPILNQHGEPFAVPVRRHIRARYDSAQTSTENVRHWQWADALSADAANSPAVRQTLRNRARYEVANNGWARAMVETLAHEVIGTGPRLQILTGNEEADAWLEQSFAAWCARARIGRKLRTMRKSKAQDGEGLGLFVSNRRYRDVMLDLRPIETDQLATPAMGLSDGQVDGIDLDEGGEPIRYHVLKHHPGDTTWAVDPLAEITPAVRPEDIVHIFRQDRPGQHRGIPEITPALPLFSKLRRYTLAVVEAAENVASLSLGLQTKHPENNSNPYEPAGTTESEPASYSTFDTFDIERSLVTVLPEDTTLFQIEPKQPPESHEAFVRVTLAEAFASVCMPYAVGAADSSQENFASGKLTRQGFKRAVTVERKLDWEPEVLRVASMWWREARFTVPPQFRDVLANPSAWIVIVYWDGVEDIDPEKAAKARAVELETGQTSYPTLYAEKGVDFETEQRKQAKAVGLTLAEYKQRLANRLYGPAATVNGGTSNAVEEKESSAD